MPLPYDAYTYLLRGLREADRPTQLLRRLYNGLQEQWGAYWDRVDSLRLLTDYRRCPDPYLRYLKDLVGIRDGDVDEMALSDPELRAFVAVAVALWKLKGTSAALTLAARVLTGRNARILTWFYRRNVLGGIYVEGEEAPGNTVVIPAPGPPTYGEWVSEVQVLDDGTLNRAAVEYLLNVLRPVSERLDLTYFDFLDTGADGDALWTPDPGGTLGLLTVDAPTRDRLFSPVGGGDSYWTPTVPALPGVPLTTSLYFARGAGAQLLLRLAVGGPAPDRLVLTADGVTLSLERRNGDGSLSVVLAAVPAVLAAGAYYTLRVETELSGGGLTVAAWVDGVRLLEGAAVGYTAPEVRWALGVHVGTVQLRTGAILHRPATTVRLGPNP